MSQPDSDIHLEVPVWARDEAFPEAPPGWGWVNAKGKPFSCESCDELAEAIRKDPDGGVCLVWTPSRRRMVLPEEVPALVDPVRQARERWVRDDLEEAAGKLKWFGFLVLGFAAWVFYLALANSARFTPVFGERVKFAAGRVFESPTFGLSVLMFVIFAALPWYQARKRKRDLAGWSEAGMAAVVPSMRFETWLDQQRAPVTKVILGLMALVGIAQLGPGNSVDMAGLVKPRYFAGEYWRLFTAPFLHGNIVHFVLNGAALLYLGKRLEVLARWPHLAMVFVFAACLGGEASARFVDAKSVGASGGLMGWLGFLVVFETLHGRLVPKSSRRRLAGLVGMTAFIGAIGYQFIDNAAHAGGLIAGMIYAVIVFPPSKSPSRPQMTGADRIGGIAAMTILTASALYAVWRITGT